MNKPIASSPSANRVTVDQILRVLNHVEKNGNDWTASCPLKGNHKHGDRKPSLTISVKDGKPLVHCHAGCDQATVWKAICELVGEPDRSYPEDATGVIPIPEEPKRKFTGTPADVERFNSALQSPAGLDYLAKRGISVGVAQRLKWGIAPKFKNQDRPALMVPHYRDGELTGIKARTIDGDKEFYQFPGSTIDGLYAADHLEDALLTDEVSMFEGPEDTALALSHGFNATGLIAAGSKVSQQDLDTLNRYSRIYLIGDQDSAGQKAMDALQDKLPAEKVIRVRLPGFKDITDIWKSNPEQFKTTLRQYLRLARTSREHFELDDLLTELEVRERQKDVTPYLVDRLIPLQSITMFFGEEKSGKSLLVTYLAKCIVNGQKVFGVLPVSKRPVLYLDLENSSDDIAGMTEHFEGIGQEPIRYKTRLTGCPELDSPGLLLRLA
jgi:DNA primase